MVRGIRTVQIDQLVSMSAWQASKNFYGAGRIPTGHTVPNPTWVCLDGQDSTPLCVQTRLHPCLDWINLTSKVHELL